MHRLRLRRARTALVAAVITATTLGTAASPAAAKRFRIVDWNVDKNPAALKKALKTTARAHGATLQEVCAAEYESLVKRAATNRRWTAHFEPSRANRDTCPTPGDTAGTVAIWTGSNTGTASATALKADPGRTPKLTCVHPPAGNKIAAICSVHLAVRSNGFTADQAKAIRKDQTWTIMSTTAPWINTGAVIVGGDFNAQPDEAAMNNMYGKPNGRGNFIAAHELAGQGPLWTVRGNEGNPKRKIDYLFFSAPQVQGTKGKLTRVKGKKLSPHSMLVATVNIK